MRTLLPLLLFAYPRAFRAAYRSQFAVDIEESPPSRYPRIAFDMVVAGTLMRADMFLRDVRYGVRMLARAPLFTAVVVGTLALAISGNAVIFSMLDAVLLQPLPFPRADRLAFMYALPTAGFGSGMNGVYFAPPLDELNRIAGRLTTATVTAAGYGQAHVQLGDRTEVVGRATVMPNFFAFLGERAEIGTLFDASADARQREAVISDALWRRHFGGTAGVLNRRITVDGISYRIRGVAPPGARDPNFTGLRRDDVWMVLPKQPPAGDVRFIPTPLVRLNDGVAWAAAQADLARAQQARAPHATGTPAYRLQPLTDMILGSARRFLWIVFGAVLAVLVVACANIANLLITRGIARDAEFAIRSALGAPNHRIGAQVMTEMLVLFSLGAAAGIGLAAAAMPAILAVMPPFPRSADTRINGDVVVYVCALTFAVMLLTGAFPALWRARQDPARALAGVRRTAARRGGRARFALVAAEIAVAFALVVCSGLLLRSFVVMTNVDVGFTPGGLTIAAFDARSARDPQLARRVAERVRRLPGIEGTAYATNVPFARGFLSFAPVHVAGRPAPQIADMRDMTTVAHVSPGYFALMRAHVGAGREFAATDRAGVAVVNAAFAARFFAHAGALGRRIDAGTGALRIVGVVANLRDSLTQPAEPTVYVPYDGRAPGFRIVVRTARPVSDLSNAIVAIGRDMLPAADPPAITPLRTAVLDDAARTRASLVLLGTLGGLALVLALAGIYSTVSYATQSRYHEIGIRMSVGASPAGVLRRIVARAAGEGAAGIAFGIVIAAATTRLLQKELFETSALDPATFAGSIAAIGACALAAAFVPAWRAARVDPAVTLRYE